MTAADSAVAPVRDKKSLPPRELSPPASRIPTQKRWASGCCGSFFLVMCLQKPHGRPSDHVSCARCAGRAPRFASGGCHIGKSPQVRRRGGESRISLANSQEDFASTRPPPPSLAWKGSLFFKEPFLFFQQ